MGVVILLLSIALTAASSGKKAPTGIVNQLPSGYEVIASARVEPEQARRQFVIVALARRNEDQLRQSVNGAPARPLLIFEQKGGRFILVGRNDSIVMPADHGGQCDPFLDGDAKIATKGPYFTVENGVACGQHWTDYITFRLDDRTEGFIFDNERQEDWELNPNNNPDAEALVRVGPQRVTRDRAGHVTTFANWAPKR